MITDTITWLNDPQNWSGPGGILSQLGAHVEFSLLAMTIAALIAIPLGLVIGHSGRGTFLVSAANALRALPTVGLLVLFVVVIAPHVHGRGDAAFLVPTEVVLVLLAVPPIMANTYAGVQNVSASTRDAAAGMGMHGNQVLLRVELPNALPLVLSGMRSATLQVISTGTIASYVGLGGLGRFVYDGLASRDFPRMAAGAVLVAALALAADLVMALTSRYTVSRGVSGRFSRHSNVPEAGTEPFAQTATTVL